MRPTRAMAGGSGPTRVRGKVCSGGTAAYTQRNGLARSNSTERQFHLVGCGFEGPPISRVAKFPPMTQSSSPQCQTQNPYPYQYGGQASNLRLLKDLLTWW